MALSTAYLAYTEQCHAKAQTDIAHSCSCLLYRRPSGSGYKVLLKWYQLKTVMLKVSLILTCLTTCLNVYETEDEVYVSEECCCYGAVIML